MGVRRLELGSRLDLNTITELDSRRAWICYLYTAEPSVFVFNDPLSTFKPQDGPTDAI